MRTVVLLSGGIDSTTALAVQRSRGDEIMPISFMYGQKHENEIKAARAIVEHYDLPTWMIVHLDDEIFASGALTGGEEMPHMTYEELRAAEGPSPTYVPFRNGNLISQATAYALVVGAGKVVVGVHAEDARHFAYPDCTPEFIGAMASAVYVGTYHEVRLEAPFQYMTKKQIIDVGTTLQVPYEKTWSCYDPVMLPDGGYIACGVCPTCVARREAFLQSGPHDPIHYAAGGPI